MKRRLLWLIAIVGLVWLWLRRGARRPEPVEHVPAPASATGDDPAEELRRKLDETKDRQGEPAGTPAQPDAPEAATDVPIPAPAGTEELDAKRREVHDRARSAADEMRGTSSD